MSPAMICTISRFVLGAAGIILLALGYHWWGFAILVIAFLTDFADGYLARRLNHVSDLGAMLDPLVDKLVVSGIIIYMIAAGILPWIAILIIICEFVLIFLAFYLKSKGKVVHSIWVGKVKFQFQWLCLLFYFLGSVIKSVELELVTIGFGILIIAAIMTWCSLYSHVLLGKQTLKGA